MGWPEVAVFENFTEQPLNFSFWSVFLITKSRELLSRTRFLRTGINKLQSETQRGLRCQSSDTNTLYSDNIPSCEKYTICTWYLFYPKWEVTWGIFAIFAWKLYFARLECVGFGGIERWCCNHLPPPPQQWPITMLVFVLSLLSNCKNMSYL